MSPIISLSYTLTSTSAHSHTHTAHTYIRSSHRDRSCNLFLGTLSCTHKDWQKKNTHRISRSEAKQPRGKNKKEKPAKLWWMKDLNQSTFIFSISSTFTLISPCVLLCFGGARITDLFVQIRQGPVLAGVPPKHTHKAQLKPSNTHMLPLLHGVGHLNLLTRHKPLMQKKRKEFKTFYVLSPMTLWTQVCLCVWKLD